MENQSIMPETDFKQKKILTFFFLLTIICPSQGEASRVKKNLKSSTFKAILMVLKVTYTLQSKCKTCFGGPRMVLQAHLKNTLLHLGVGY